MGKATCYFCIVRTVIRWLMQPTFGPICQHPKLEAPSKDFLLFFLLPDWLKLNHLKSRTECGFSDIFRAIFVPP